MKAWHIKDLKNNKEELFFARNEKELKKSLELLELGEIESTTITRAAFADDYNTKPVELLELLLENNWKLSCTTNCGEVIIVKDNYVIVDGYIYCHKCKENYV